MTSASTAKFSRAFFFATAMCFAVAAHSVQADEGPWRIVKIEGQAFVATEGVQPISTNPGDTLAPGQTITTGKGGFVVIERGGSSIVVSPESTLAVPEPSPNSLMTRVKHLVGTLLFNVDKRKEQHFEVITPDVAVVVKGTSFTTSVGQGGALVHVVSGLVEITNIATGVPVLARPGETVGTARNSGVLNIQRNGVGPQPSAVDTAPADNRGNGVVRAAATSGIQGKGLVIAAAITGKQISVGQASKGLLRSANFVSNGRGNGVNGNQGNNGQGINANKGPKTNPGQIVGLGNRPVGVGRGNNNAGGNGIGNGGNPPGHSNAGGNPGNNGNNGNPPAHSNAGGNNP